MKKLLQEARDVLLTCDAGKFDKGAEVIDALEAAIAQGESDPVGEVIKGVGTMRSIKWANGMLPLGGKLYTSPQVASDYVPLSDEDIDGIGSTYEPHSRRKFARLVERAVRGDKP